MTTGKDKLSHHGAGRPLNLRTISLFTAGLAALCFNESLAFTPPNKPPSGQPSKTSLDKLPKRIDKEAFESKNKARAKFGLKPLSIEEYLDIEDQIREMEAKYLAEQQQDEIGERNENSNHNFFDQVMDFLNINTCTTHFDCEYPEVCCDLGLKKVCCDIGLPVNNFFTDKELAPVPIPVEICDSHF